MRERLTYAAYGVLATLLGVATGHLVASLTDPASSPVLAVGSTVIDLTPTPVKEWAVAQFGTKDKPILIGSVFAGVLVLSAVAGVLARRRFLLGAGLLVALVALAGAAALSRPTATVADVLPAVAAGVVGLAALWWLVRLDGSRDGRDRPPRPATQAPTRRGVLVTAGVMAAAAVAMGAAGRQIARARGVIKDLTLPAAADPAPAFPQGIEGKVPGVAPFRTPNADFYRIDTRLTLPVIDVDTWTLTIDGDVEEDMTFTFDDLLGMPLIERDITLTCVSNDIGGPYVSGTRFTGVRLTDLLDRAKVGSTADQILSTDVDGMTISTPLDLATDGRDAMIAIAMDGEALPRDHGYPARMVVPGLYGYVSACKWITRMTLDDVRREAGVLDRPRLGHRRPDQADEPDRHPEATGEREGRQDLHRGRRLAPAPRPAGRAGAHRRRRLAGRDPRARRRQRLLAAVVRRVGRGQGRVRPAHPRREGDLHGRRRAVRRPDDALPRRRHRRPVDRRQRRLNRSDR